MSQPDLKMIGESLFYKYGIFTINEQEDCRETAYNLVDFLEYLRLIVGIFLSFSFLFNENI